MENLATLGIKTVGDLLTHYPSRYDDFAPTDLTVAKDKQKVTVKGTVVSEPLMSRYGYRRSRMSFRLVVGQAGVVNVVYFNQPYLKQQVEPNHDVTVLGTWDAPASKFWAPN